MPELACALLFPKPDRSRGGIVAGRLVQRSQETGGFTFTELIVTVALALIVTAAVFQLVEVGQAVFRKNPDRTAQQRIHTALEPGWTAACDVAPRRSIAADVPSGCL
jgi:Tfp pilus assembly protein FimT